MEDLICLLATVRTLKLNYGLRIDGVIKYELLLKVDDVIKLL